MKNATNQITEGMSVFHKRHGNGVVDSIEGGTCLVTFEPKMLKRVHVNKLTKGYVVLNVHNKKHDCEIFVPVVGYEGNYDISNFGTLRSLRKIYGLRIRKKMGAHYSAKMFQELGMSANEIADKLNLKFVTEGSKRTAVSRLLNWKLPSKATVKKGIVRRSNSRNQTMVTLYDCDGVSKKFHIANLVAAHFIPNLNMGPHVYFIDGNSTNVKSSNLRYGRYGEGIANSLSKLADEDVIEMRRAYENNEVSMKGLTKKYGISIGNVSQILNRKTWKHIQ